MGYEGQLGAIDTWLDRTYTSEGERPWMANTLKAHQDHSQRQGLLSFLACLSPIYSSKE